MKKTLGFNEKKNNLKKDNPCFNNPCLNGATCQPSGNSYACVCAQFYSGTTCQICNLKLKKKLHIRVWIILDFW